MDGKKAMGFAGVYDRCGKCPRFHILEAIEE